MKNILITGSTDGIGKLSKEILRKENCTLLTVKKAQNDQ